MEDRAGKAQAEVLSVTPKGRKALQPDEAEWKAFIAS